MRRLAAVMSAALLLGASADGALAQFSPGARSVGMGGAGMVYASRVDAVEWNPANLALDGGWAIALGDAGGAALFTGVNLDDFRSLVESEDSTAAAAVVDALPASGISLSTVTDGFATAKGTEAADLPGPGSPYPSFGIAFGSFGLRVRSHVLGEVRMSKELADLIANGFDAGKIQDYRMGDTGFRTTSFSEITAAYGSRLGERLALGVGVRYVKGHKLTEARFFEPVLDLLNETAEVTAVAVEARGGSGFGVDVGLALDLAMGLRVSASGTNVIQKMTWDEDALFAHEATFFGCDTSNPGCTQSDFGISVEDMIDRFVEQPLDDPSSMSLEVYQTAQDLLPGAFFPTVFRLGGGWRAGGTSIELVGASVSPRGNQRTQWEERISLGLEQRLWFLTLRAGGAKGSDGIQAISGGFGLGLGPVHLDVSGGVMSGGFDFASGVVASENVDYAGGHVTASLQIIGG